MSNPHFNFFSLSCVPMSILSITLLYILILINTQESHITRAVGPTKNCSFTGSLINNQSPGLHGYPSLEQFTNSAPPLLTFHRAIPTAASTAAVCAVVARELGPHQSTQAQQHQ